jgi:ubiquinone/menaquinone biosynthesis C-methylase UbiE
LKKAESNKAAQDRWNQRAVGAQRATAPKGTREYFDQIERYRYGYETPFIKDLLLSDLSGKSVLEIGVGNGIDASAICDRAASYVGIDITRNHLDLAGENLKQKGFNNFSLVQGDLTEFDFGSQKFDVVYSFGVLHHIAHEEDFLNKIKDILNPGGELRLAVYSQWSFFNAYILATWLLRNRRKVGFNLWQGYLTDASSFDNPIVVKVRSKSDVQRMLERNGFGVKKYWKRGFVQNYIPWIGKRFEPNVMVLNTLGSVLGWYHVFIVEVKRS